MTADHLGKLVWRALETLTDLAVVLDDRALVVHLNPHGCQLLGVQLDDVVGTSITDHLHPDDLTRAALVMGRIADGDLGVPVTPAMYRLRRSDGSWLRVELNGVAVADDDGADHLVVLGRYSGDHDLQDRLLGLLTSGAAADDAIALVPEFGLWRHRGIDYAVLFRDDHGHHQATGSDVLVSLGPPDDPEGPWARAVAGDDQHLAVDELSPAWADRARAAGLTDLVGIAVPDPLHSTHAVVAFGRRHDGAAPEVHEYALEVMAKALGLVLQWRHQVIGLQRAARRDPLTGVANRAGFWELLERFDLATDTTDVAVLYVDLDGFKAVNDEHGHAVGDRVLAEVATRLAGAVRPGDVVARLGGDEFAVVAHGVHDEDGPGAIAQRIVAAVGRPFHVDGSAIALGASVGIATARGEGFDADLLLELADRALYQAKSDGRGRWRLAGP